MTEETQGEIADLINVALLEAAPVLRMVGYDDTLVVLYNCFEALMNKVQEHEDTSVTLAIPASFEERIPYVLEAFQEAMAAEADAADEADDEHEYTEAVFDVLGSYEEARASTALDGETQVIPPDTRTPEQILADHFASVIDEDVKAFEADEDAP